MTSDKRPYWIRSCLKVPVNVILLSNWTCSNGNKMSSLCLRISSSGTKQKKKCVCKRDACSWLNKNSHEVISETTGENTGSPENYDQSLGRFSNWWLLDGTFSQSTHAISDSGQSESALLASFWKLILDFLHSIVREININDSTVNFNIHMK